MSMTTFANFLVNWKIDRTGFNRISREKRIVTAHNGMSFYLIVGFRKLQHEESLDSFFFISYMDGPSQKLQDIRCKVEVVKPSKAEVSLMFSKMVTVDRGCTYRLYSMEKEEIGLLKTEHIVCQITLSIPIDAFSFTMQNPLPTTDSPHFLRKMFEKIDDPEKALFWNAKLISNDGDMFYCDKNILANQSDVFLKMFQFPKPKKAELDEYEFPQCSEALRGLLEFIYTGRPTMSDLSTTAIIELADAAEQHGFKSLLAACGSVLWDELVKLSPSDDSRDIFKIIQRCHLHNELKYVKYRAFEILAQNYEDLYRMINDNEYWGTGSEGQHFKTQFDWYQNRRVEPYFNTCLSSHFCRINFG